MLIWTKLPSLAPPDKRRGGPTDTEPISHRPSLKYTKDETRKLGMLLVVFLFFLSPPYKNIISFKEQILGS